MHYPLIDPIIFEVGPLAVRWYGMTYLAAFLMAWGLGVWRAGRYHRDWSRDDVSDAVFYGALGAILGGRFGYVFFYGFEQFLRDPVWLIRIWDGGMSFHGGMIGGMVGLWLFGRQQGRKFFEVTDFAVPLVPLGLGLGRIGNFINVELPGRPTDAITGIIYPCTETIRNINPLCTGQWESFARHPSPLYQAFAEGIVLFAVVWIFARRPRPVGTVSAVFLIGYGVLRFITEHFRMPDAHVGFVAFDWLTRGQLLSLPMVLFGILLFLWSVQRAGARAPRKTSQG